MSRASDLICALAGICSELEQHVQSFASGGECQVIAEKQFPGIPTVEGEICRLTARIQYLTAVLNCEGQQFPPDPERLKMCCAAAADSYCTAFDACPA